jgi:hypothetical protein
VRAGGEGAFLINPGVLITFVRTPFPPARRVAVLCADKSPFRPLRLGTEAQPLSFHLHFPLLVTPFAAVDIFRVQVRKHEG